MISLKNFLFAPRLPLWKYCLMAAPLCLIPSFALISVAEFCVTAFGFNVESLLPRYSGISFVDVLGTVFFAPTVETLLLSVGVNNLLKTQLKPLQIATISAIIWGCFHAIFGPLKFFGTVWSFFVLTCSYMAWMKVSPRCAFLAAAVPHSLVNALLVTYLLVSESW